MDCEYSWVEPIERGELLSFEEVIKLFNRAYQILAAEPNIVELDGNITLVTCIRGNFRSLMHVLQTAGHASKTQYLFIGGYIGREQLSLECLLLVLALKELYPHQITLLQGREMNYIYHIKQELESKYAEDEAQQILLGLSDVFTAMPIAALVNKKIFCIHGGLTPEIDLLEQITAIPRFQQNGAELIENLVAGYAEPDQDGWGLSNAGIGYTYGKDIFEKFLKDNNLEEMIAARMRSCEGSDYSFDNKLLEFFSAAEYVGLNNRGAIVQIFVDADGKTRKTIISYASLLK